MHRVLWGVLCVALCAHCSVKKKTAIDTRFDDENNSANSAGDDEELWDVPLGVETQLEETAPGYVAGKVQLLTLDDTEEPWKGFYEASYNDGLVEVVLSHASSSEKAVVKLDQHTGKAFLRVGEFSTEVDGEGALTDTQRFYIDAFAQSDMAKAMALMALEMGCMNPAEVSKAVGFEGDDTSPGESAPPDGNGAPQAQNPPATPAPGENAVEPTLEEEDTQKAQRENVWRALNAAAVYPWQLLVKYGVLFPSAENMLTRASCAYGVQESASEAGETQTPQTSAARWLVYEEGDIVPYVPGYWPFDAEGAVTRNLTRGVAVGPCGALCRGTCGPDCPQNNCTTTYEWHCGQGSVRNLWRHKVCGSHAGCRAHDGCYDACNTTHGCGTWGAATCRRACDAQCLTDYCWWCAASPLLCNSYTCNCVSWMNGNGPYDMWDHYWWHIQPESCDDQNACTADGCAQNACTHTPVVCNDNNGCTVDNCAPSTGCSYAPYTGCDDQNACTVDTCTNGPQNTPACGHSDVSCDDNNPCTVDSCDPVQGCMHTPMVCNDDGNVCNGMEVCEPTSGACVHSAPLVCNDTNLCTQDSCDASLGCMYEPVDCLGDGDVCNGIEVCNPATGLCDGLAPSPCDDFNNCTTDTCSPDSGCSYAYVVCADDSNICNGMEMCNPVDGSCTSMGGLLCDDANPCTQDSCNSSTGCVYTPVENSTACVGSNSPGGGTGNEVSNGPSNQVSNSIPVQ
jgi:hypothetical protein